MIIASIAAGAAAGAASASERVIWFENIRVAEGWLEVDLEVPGGFPPNVVETLGRGVPATVVYEIEVWRSRPRWFDRLEATQYLLFQIDHDPWENAYRVRGPEGTSRGHDSIEEIAADVLRPTSIRIAPLRRIDPGSPHYLSVRFGVKPLALQEVRAIEEWLNGNIPGDEKRPEPGAGILGIPEKLFGFFAGLAGLGEERVEARSVTFMPIGLE
jgi:hypothetical protein